MSGERVIFYLRLSVSREASTSIERQRADLDALAEREGWTVVATFSDDGVSGAKDRDNATSALRMLRRGEADVLAVWKLDRWSRQGLGAVADLIDVLDRRERAGKPALFVALSDGLRSDQSSWRLIAGVLSEVARQERDSTSIRTQSSIAKLKREGRFSGGTVPLGYRSSPAPDGPGRVLVPDETESRFLTEAAARIVGGASPYSTAVWLNQTDFRPRRATTWTIQALTQALQGSAIVGRVTQNGDVRRDENGMPLQVWPPAIPLDLWHSVRSTIEGRRVGAPKVGVREVSDRSRLLSGILVCGECGYPMYVRKTSTGIPIYGCLSRTNGRDTPSVSVTAARIEEHVEAHYLRLVGGYEVFRPVEDDAPALALVEAQAALKELSSQLGDADLDDAREVELLEQRRQLRDRVRALREEASGAQNEVELVPTGKTFAEAWAEFSDDLDARRALLAAAFDSIEVSAGRKGARGLDQSRVRISMRAPADDYNAQ